MLAVLIKYIESKQTKRSYKELYRKKKRQKKSQRINVGLKMLFKEIM